MSWIADAGMPAVALWIALLLSGVVAGTFTARWQHPGRADRTAERMMLTAAGAGVVALCANAGALLGSATGNALLAAHVPIATGAGYRLAVLWSTLPGASLTLAVILLVIAALGGSRRRPAATRSVAVLSVAAVAALGTSAWFAPPPNAAATSVLVRTRGPSGADAWPSLRRAGLRVRP
jgi:cytochrome c biogenesis factor